MRYLKIVIPVVLFALAVVFMTLNGKPHAYHLLSLICAIACGWFAKVAKG